MERVKERQRCSEKKTQQARDRVRQVGQGDVERDIWKDREMGKETGRQTDTEGRALQEEDLRSLVSAPVGAGQRQDQGSSPVPHQGLHPSLWIP